MIAFWNVLRRKNFDLPELFVWNINSAGKSKYKYLKMSSVIVEIMWKNFNI